MIIILMQNSIFMRGLVASAFRVIADNHDVLFIIFIFDLLSKHYHERGGKEQLHFVLAIIMINFIPKL